MPLGIKPTVDDHEADTLKTLLPGIEFDTAITAIETISEKTKDKQMYDQRDKAQRDYEWTLSGAREQGREQGREEGMEQGVEKGKLTGTIQTLQVLLDEPISTDSELTSADSSMLQIQIAELQQRLRNRQA